MLSDQKRAGLDILTHGDLHCDDDLAGRSWHHSEQLIVSSDCGFGRQGCNREIGFFKSVAIAQGTNIVRRALGLPETPIRAAEPKLQTDIVPKTPDR